MRAARRRKLFLGPAKLVTSLRALTAGIVDDAKERHIAETVSEIDRTEPLRQTLEASLEES